MIPAPLAWLVHCVHSLLLTATVKRPDPELSAPMYVPSYRGPNSWMVGELSARTCGSSTHALDLGLDSGVRSTVDTVAMADCCCPEPHPGDPSAKCSECGTAGRPVESVTVKAMLTMSALARYEHHAYRFCPDPGCVVVYFGQDGTIFTTSDVRERIWQKEPPGRRTVCYCFGETEADIAAEIERRGQSDAVQRVRTHIAAGRCACETRNPRGSCCLGDVIAAAERLSVAKVSGS